MNTKRSSVLRPDFKAEPFWWEAYRPTDGGLADVPREVSVVIVGGGYAGLSCALELARSGVSVCVLEAAELGVGASTTNGGCVMGGFRLGKTTAQSGTRDLHQAFSESVAQAYKFLDEIIERERISCSWEKGGRFVAAWTPEHHAKQIQAIEALPPQERLGLRPISREEQRSVVATGFYYGGILAEKSGKLHPALYYKGLFDAVRRHEVAICANAEVTAISREIGGWCVKTRRGGVRSEHVVIATNGYTGKITPELRRRLIPIASHAVATEELEEDLARSLLPGGRTVSETQRVLCWYRFEGRRLIFGGRARFTYLEPHVAATLMHGIMIRRFPQLKEARITHVWTGNIAKTFDDVPHTGVMNGMHYAVGCNGSGVAMMTYLGREIALRILGRSDGRCGFELPHFPAVPFYSGDPWWVLPIVGGYYRMRDEMDRARAERQEP